jgi:type II secretory pathway component PulF
MARYRFSAKSPDGSTQSGVLEANERKNAVRQLQQRGLVPIRISEERNSSPRQSGNAGTASAPKTKTPPQNKPRRTAPAGGKIRANHNDGLTVAKRLLELHSGGLSLGDSVLLLSQRLSEVRLKSITSELWTHLREGRSFAKASEALPGLFPSAVIPLFEAGEASGDMVSILRNTIEYIEERRQLRSKVLGSLAYPAVLVGLVLIILVGFVFVLMPRIQQMIDSMGGKMNFFTQVLIDSSEWMLKAGPFILIAGVLGLMALFQWRRKESGRLITDRWALKIPMVGGILEASDLYQLSNLMGTLMESGISASENLKLSERTLQNRHLRQRFSAARSAIVEGASFSIAFRQQQLYPDASIDILTVGENTGHLERGLKEITRSIRSLLDQRLKAFTLTVSTLAMAGAFLMVLFAALGMVLSVLEVSQTISFQ